MPVTVFDIKGLPGHRRERIEAAVVACRKHTKATHEAWIAADPFIGGVTCSAAVVGVRPKSEIARRLDRVLATRPHASRCYAVS
jgi:hypothetical protein